MVRIETCVKGLFAIYSDCETIYRRYKSRKNFTVCGEWANGDAWINDAHYGYKRDAGKVLLTAGDAVVYSFDDSEHGWAQFANTVL